MALGAADGAGTPCPCDEVTARAAAEPLYLGPLDHRRPGAPPKPLSTRRGPSSQQRASGRTRSLVPQSPWKRRSPSAGSESRWCLPGGEEAAAGTGPGRTGRGGPGAALMWSAGAGSAQLTLSPTERQQYRLHTAQPNVSASPWEQTLADGTFWKRCQRVTKDANLTIKTQQRGPLVNREQFQTRKKLKNKTEQNHPPNCWRRPQPGGASRRAWFSCRPSLEAEKHRAMPASLSPHPAAASRTSGPARRWLTLGQGVPYDLLPQGRGRPCTHTLSLQPCAPTQIRGGHGAEECSVRRAPPRSRPPWAPSSLGAWHSPAGSRLGPWPGPSRASFRTSRG